MSQPSARRLRLSLNLHQVGASRAPHIFRAPVNERTLLNNIMSLERSTFILRSQQLQQLHRDCYDDTRMVLNLLSWQLASTSHMMFETNLTPAGLKWGDQHFRCSHLK